MTKFEIACFILLSLKSEPIENGYRRINYNIEVEANSDTGYLFFKGERLLSFDTSTNKPNSLPSGSFDLYLELLNDYLGKDCILIGGLLGICAARHFCQCTTLVANSTYRVTDKDLPNRDELGYLYFEWRSDTKQKYFIFAYGEHEWVFFDTVNTIYEPTNYSTEHIDILLTKMLKYINTLLTVSNYKSGNNVSFANHIRYRGEFVEIVKGDEILPQNNVLIAANEDTFYLCSTRDNRYWHLNSEGVTIKVH